MKSVFIFSLSIDSSNNNLFSRAIFIFLINKLIKNTIPTIANKTNVHTITSKYFGSNKSNIFLLMNLLFSGNFKGLISYSKIAS